MNSQTTTPKRQWLALLAATFAMHDLAGQAVVPSTASAQDNDPLVLSPFVVNTSEDIGYQGGNTTSGSRLNARLKDTAAAVHVFTNEFLSDFALNTFEEMAAYSPNMQLDFLDTTEAANPAILGQADNLNAWFRVRGLRASHGNDYFSTSVPVDGYNSGRFEVASGPNSILFGLGSAGGVANITTKQADSRRTFGSVRLQAGSDEFWRGEIDHNQVLLRDRLALRIMGLWQNAESWRKYDFHDIERATVALGVKPWKAGLLNFSYEKGYHKDHITRPSNAFDSHRLWTNAGGRTFDANLFTNADRSTGVARSANVRNIWVAGTNTATSFIPVANVNNRRILESIYEDLNLPAAQRAGATLLPREEHPYEYSSYGPGAWKRTDFTRVSASFDQKLWEHGALQVAFRHEKTHPSGYNFQGPGGSLQADPNSVIPHPNGTATSIMNPNAGRYYMEAVWGYDSGTYETKSGRVMTSWEINRGKWWGAHTISGLFEKGRNSTESYPGYEILVDENNVPIGNAAVPENVENHLTRRQYVTLGQFDTYYMGNVHEPVSIVANGKTYHTAFVNRSLNRTRVRQETESMMFATQSKFWRDKIILTAGIRRDTVKFNEYGAGRIAPNDPEVLAGKAIANGLIFTDEIVKVDTYRPHTETLGGVFHVTKYLSVFYNQSSSIGEPSAIRRVLPDLDLPPPPDGVTQDYGFMVNLLDGRVFLRATAFETKEEKRVAATLVAGSFANRSNFIFDTLLATGRITAAEHQANYFTDTGLITSVADVKNDGYEVALSVNPKKNLTGMVNFSATNVDRSNIAPEYDLWRDRVEGLWSRNPANGALLTGSGETVQRHAEEITRYVEDLRAGLGFNWGERKYKANASARYTFTEGRLSGLFIGGGTRWASAANVGRRIAGTTSAGSPIYGESVKGAEDFSVDAFAGYRTRFKVAGRERRFLFQLNVYNVTNEDVFQPLRHNLLFTGYARGLLDRPRTFRFSFGMEY